MLQHVASLYSGVAEAWCQLTHPEPMWPIHGHYICPKCLRTYPVRWESRLGPPHSEAASRTRRAA